MTDTSWIDKGLYPFGHNWFEVEHKALHYVDVGQGDPVVFVHGTPTWSFMYRDLIKGLMGSFRCVAVDNLGFGLSDKPPGYTYRPEKMAQHLAELIRHLGLRDITMVVSGIGGPIGLSYAIDHPENMKHLVLLNTFMWPLKGNREAESFASKASGGLFRWAHLNWNYGLISTFRSRIRDKAHFTKKVHQHYRKPFPTPETRQAPLQYAQALISAGPWFQNLWERRHAIQNTPALLAWGLGDTVFGPDALARWQELWPEARVKRFKTAGHYVAEEKGAGLVPEVGMFLNDTDYLPTATVDV